MGKEWIKENNVLLKYFKTESRQSPLKHDKTRVEDKLRIEQCKKKHKIKKPMLLGKETTNKWWHYEY